MTLPSETESAYATEQPKPKGFRARLSGVYFSPRETFREIGLSPRVLAHVIVLVVIGLLVGFYLTQKLDFAGMMAEQMEKAVAEGRITREQMEQQLSVISKFARYQVIVGSALGSLLVALVISIGFKLISGLIGASSTFKALFAVTLYAMIAVTIIQSGLLILVLQIKGTEELNPAQMSSVVASNLGALLSGYLGDDALPAFFMRLFRFVDIFAIWVIALLAIGYSAVSRKLKTSTAAIWLSSAYAVIAIIGSVIGPSVAR